MMNQTDLMTQATYHNKLGLEYHRKKNYSEALKQFTAAFKIAEQIGDSNKQLLYLNNIGGIYKVLKNNEMSLKILQRVLTIAKQQKNQLLEAITLNRMGLIYHNKGTLYKEREEYAEALVSFKEAMRNYKIALNIAKQIENNDVIVVSQNNIAGIYEAQGNYAKSLNTYQKAFEMLHKKGLEHSLNAERIRKNINFLKKLIKEKIEANHHN